MTDGDRIAVGRLADDEVEPVASSTTILVRDRPDGADGFEVFMLERHVETEFAGGAFVFPGGRVEEGDRSLDPSLWEGIDLPAAATEMGVEEPLALGLHVAALRETFEESGFLLARRGGEPLTAADLADPAVREVRERLASREPDHGWADWLARERIVLDLGALAWWSWWVTPRGVHRRYETWFFVAEVPSDQVGAHDDVEAVASRWITPGEALAAGRAGEVTVVYPTRHNLRALEEHRSAAALLAAARAGEVDRRRTLPEIVVGDGGEITIRHPHTGELDTP